MRNLNVNGLGKFLEIPRKIIITTHHKPDGDAMGSSLGLFNYLILQNHHVYVVAPSDHPEFLNWMPGAENVVNFEKDPSEATRLFNRADLIFCLDFNGSRRVEKMEELLLSADAPRVIIDHHLDPTLPALYTYSFTDACATCELVYDFICSLGHKAMINKEIAECLYTGIMTDTGSFRFPSMKAHVHRIIADLMEAGARNSYIHEEVYDNNSEHRLRLLGYCLQEKLVVMPEIGIAYFTISKEELDRFNFRTGDTEGVVNFALSIAGIKVAAFFAERKDEIKISFRSKEDFSVKEIAERYFEGGGHRNAAGGRSKEGLELASSRFVEIMKGLKHTMVSE